MSLRKITSLTALLSFIALIFSSIVSFLAPRGPGSSQWEALGLGKHEWFSLHTNLGILFLVAGIVHTIFNIKPIIAYVKNKAGRFRLFTLNFSIALLLTIWMIISSIYSWPPISSIAQFKDSLRSNRHLQTEPVEEKRIPFPEKPPLFYSNRSLERFCESYGLDTEAMARRLTDLGITARPEWTIKVIAEKNDTEPAAVFEVLRPAGE